MAKSSEVKKAVLAFVNHAEQEGHAHTAEEILKALPTFTKRDIEDAMLGLWSAGRIFRFKAKGRWHWRPVKGNPSPGERKHGPHASADERLAALEAVKAATAFYGNAELATKAKKLRGYKAPLAFVDIGDAVALEYDSDKFDGKPRIYRHECEVKRKMLISTDGSTVVFSPPFKVTKKGIEG